MHILVLGAAGMLGRKLAASLLEGRELGGQPIARLTLAAALPFTTPTKTLGNSSCCSEP